MAISDEELRGRLTALGCDVGPIDDTTRPLYVAMLKRRESGEKTGRQGRSSKSTSGWSNTSTNHEPHSGARSRTSGRSRGKSSQAFSSDEEAPTETSPPTRRSTTFALNDGHVPYYRRVADNNNSMTPRSIASSTMYTSPVGGLSSGLEDSGGGDVDLSLFSTRLSPVRPDTPPLSLISRSEKYTRRPLHPPNSNTYNSSSSSSGGGSSNNNNNNSSNKNNLNHSPHHSTNHYGAVSSGLYSAAAAVGTANGFSDDEHDHRHNQEKPLTSRFFKPISSFGLGRGLPEVVQPGYSAGANGVRPGQRSPPPQSAMAGGSVRSHFVPKLLMWITVGFFLGLAILYYRLGQDGSPSLETDVPNALEKIRYVACSEPPNADEQEGYSCIRQERVDESLKVAKMIQTLLSEKKHEQVCGNGQPDLEGLPYREAAEQTATSLDGDIFSGAVYLITENPSWGVDVSRDSEDVFLMPHYLAPLWCRLQRAMMQMCLQAMLFVFLVVVGGCTYWYIQNRKSHYRNRTRQINGLLEDIADLLTNNAADNPETPYMPILEIRDKLLPTAARNRQAAQLWSEAEVALEKTEGARVAREKQRVRGEWFQVWRWLAPPPTQNGQWGMGSKVWQGKAFDGSSAGRPLTNCLKIKNMFNKLEERGEDWVQDVERELLTKCGPNHGIVHMRVAEDSPDGIVYAKMVSLEAAGEVYRKLHGSWFDRRLVTAKYLREKRYHEKFPESVGLGSQMEL